MEGGKHSAVCGIKRSLHEAGRSERQIRKFRYAPSGREGFHDSDGAAVECAMRREKKSSGISRNDRRKLILVGAV